MSENQKYVTIFLGAHSDDVSWTAGGLFRKLADQGKETYEILLTDSRGDKGVDLREIRKLEAEKEAEILGIKRVYHVGLESGFEDGKLDTYGLDKLMPAVIPIINQIAKGRNVRLVTFGKDGFTKHRDHLEIDKLAEELMNKMKKIRERWNVVMHPGLRKKFLKDYNYQGEPYNLNGERLDIPLVKKYNREIDITKTFKQKIAGIGSHISQLTNGGNWYMETLQRMRKIGRKEYYQVIKNKR